MPSPTPTSSIKTRIIAWSFVPTVIILAAVAWFTFYSYQKVTEDLVLTQDEDITSLQTTEISGRFIGAINPPLLQLIFEWDSAKDEEILNRAQIILDNGRDSLLAVFDGGLVFTDANGNIILTDPIRPDLEGKNWSDKPYFQYAVANPGRAGFSNIQNDGINGSQVMEFSISLVNSTGQLSGVLILMFNVAPVETTSMYKIFSQYASTEPFYLIDGNNYIFYSPDAGIIGTEYKGKSPWMLEEGEFQPASWLRDDQTNQIISYGPVLSTPPSRWWLVRQQDWDTLMKPSLAYRRLLLLLLALGVLVPVAVVSFGVRRITQPIQELIEASKSIADGEFSKRIAASTNDELAELASQFNRMSERLQESYSTLEENVAERTKELGILNSISNVANQSLELDEILESTLEKTLEKTIMESGVAFQVEQSTQTLLLQACRGFPPEKIKDISNISIKEQNKVSELFNFQIQEIETKTMPEMLLKNWLTAEKIQKVVIVPLSTRARVHGYLLLGARGDRTITSNEIGLFRSIGQQIGVALENARLYEQAEETATTAERNRLARELHDAVTQTLFSTSLIAEVLPELWKINPQEAEKRTMELKKLTRGALAEMRTLLLELRPAAMADIPLSDLLRQLAEAASSRAQIPIELSTSGNALISEDIKLALYRITQEALNNIVKHSNATAVNVNLSTDANKVLLVIQDNGKGFDPNKVSKEHFGLDIMKERAETISAKFNLITDKNRGTTVQVEWFPEN